jgi:hypothetical protein
MQNEIFSWTNNNLHKVEVPEVVHVGILSSTSQKKKVKKEKKKRFPGCFQAASQQMQWRAFNHPVHSAPSTALLYTISCCPVEIIPMRASSRSSKPRFYCHRSTQYIVHLCRRRHSCQRGTNTIALLCSSSTRYPSHVSWG